MLFRRLQEHLNSLRTKEKNKRKIRRNKGGHEGLCRSFWVEEVQMRSGKQHVIEERRGDGGTFQRLSGTRVVAQATTTNG